MSPLGDDFTRDRFVRTPTKTIKRVLAAISEEEKRSANMSSLTTAQLAHLLLNVAHGFSGAKGSAPKVKPKDFLPFPDWRPSSTVDADGPDQTTRFILGQLIKDRTIPMHVFKALMSAPSTDGNM